MLTRRTISTALVLLALGGCGGPGAGTGVQEDLGDPVGPFTLVDSDGQPVTEEVLKGRWSAVYFGFTYCPDVCPTTLLALKAGLDQMGADREAIQPILISVDPDRDTPQVMKDYVNIPGFPDNLRGFTGTPDQIAQAAKAFGVYYAKTEDGTIQHQSIIFVMDPQGRMVRPLTGALTPDQIAAQIGDAMRQAG